MADGRVIEVPVKVRLVLDDVPGVHEVRRLVLRPGDKLVVRVDTYPDEAELAKMRESLRAVLGDEVPILIVEQGIDLEVISADPSGALWGRCWG